MIVGDELVTHDPKLADDAQVEIRPVIQWAAATGGAGGEDGSDRMKCRVCQDRR